MDKWSGQVAVVTGASSGIGAAICERLAKAGVRVVGLARRVARIEALAKQLKSDGQLHAVYCDVTSEDSIIQAFAEIASTVGPPAILINNAGVMTDTQLIDGDAAKWRRTLDTNVLGLCMVTREALRLMMAHRIDGHIVHINSVTGHAHVYVDGVNVYGASKHAVTNLAEVLRRELLAKGSKIKITSLSPGIVKTELFENTAEAIRSLAMDCALEPEDIAEGVAYVLSTPRHVQVHELTIKPLGELI